MNQQTKGLNKNISTKGCKYLCHLRISELESGAVMTVDTLNMLYDNHKEKNWLANTCDVLNPNEIMASFMNSLGARRPLLRQIGRNPGDGVYHFWGNIQTRPAKYHAVEYKTTNGSHWILCDSLMNELYDPWAADYTRVKINSINIIG